MYDIHTANFWDVIIHLIYNERPMYYANFKDKLKAASTLTFSDEHILNSYEVLNHHCLYEFLIEYMKYINPSTILDGFYYYYEEKAGIISDDSNFLSKFISSLKSKRKICSEYQKFLKSYSLFIHVLFYNIEVLETACIKYGKNFVANLVESAYTTDFFDDGGEYAKLIAWKKIAEDDTNGTSFNFEDISNVTEEDYKYVKEYLGL
jgi:hypothetical protein